MAITGSDTPGAGTSTLAAADLGVSDLAAYQITFQFTGLGVNTLTINGRGPGGEYDEIATGVANKATLVVGKQDDPWFDQFQFVASAGTAHVIHWAAVEKVGNLR